MYETIKKLYRERKISKDSIKNAINKKFITEKQAKEIMNET